MDYVRLGRSSLKVSPICFGLMGIGNPSWRSWVLDESNGTPVIEAALKSGINFFDTCDFYSAGASEEVFGKLIERMGVRNEVVIATKVGNPMGRGPNASGYSKKHIVEGVEASLKRLRTDRIDLYQTHIWNTATDLEEMIDAFDLLVRQGKVLYLGATDLPCWQLAQSVYRARIAGKAAFTTVQHHYNAAWREDERDVVPFARSEGMGLMPYSPLARGFFSGAEKRAANDTERYRTDEYIGQWYGRPADLQVAEAIDAVASRRGLTAGQVALMWVRAACPGSVPVVGAHSVAHLDTLLASLTEKLSAEEMEEIGRNYEPRRRGGHF